MIPTDQYAVPGPVEVPDLSFSVDLDEGTGSMHVAGELEIEAVPVFAGVVAGQVAHARVDLRLDVSCLTFFDLAGLDAICAAQSALEEHGGRLVVVGASPLLRTVAELFGHGDLFASPPVAAPSRPESPPEH